MANRKYTTEHIAFLAENITGCYFADLTELFNARFGFTLSVSAVISLTARHGLHNGIDSKLNRGYKPTQFKKGHIPANKGKKGVCAPGCEKTQFRPGNRPWNYKPVGTERVNTDGYVDVKIADPNKWRAKHVLIWEAAHGPIPKGYALVFADGDKLHVELENLLLVTRGQLARLNQNHLIQADPELTKSGLLVADIITKCAERKRGAKRKERRNNGKINV